MRGEKIDCLAMTEPDAGSDVRSMKTFARRDGADYVINGTKHFISHADIADFAIVFVATGSEATAKGPKQRITCFLIDRGTPGFEIREGYRRVSHRGYHNCILHFADCRVPATQVLGEEGQGFELMNTWLYATRLAVAAMCVGRARRVLRPRRRVVRDAQAVRPADRQVPGHLVQARRHGDRDRRRRSADALCRLDA